MNPDCPEEPPAEVVAAEEPVTRCESCKRIIDPECCWCGGEIAKHSPWSDNHAPIPMGCVCGYDKSSEIVDTRPHIGQDLMP